MRLFVLALAAATSMTTSEAGIAVLSAGAVEEAVIRLAAQYKQDLGHEVTARFGTGPEIQTQLSSGASADVLIAPAAVVDRAIKTGDALADTRTPIARVGVGITVRRGATPPDGSSIEALKNALLAADSVVYNQASTGQYLEALFARMGILHQLAAKTTRYGNAAQVLEHVIAGKGNEIGFGPITEIKSFEPKGVVLVAPLPQDAQNYTTYIAAVMSRAASREQALAFIQFLTSAPARDVFAATGAQ